MSARRFLTALVVATSLTSAATAQTVLLGEAPLVDRCCRVKLTLDLRGKISFQRQGKTETIAHQAAAEHRYSERVLDAKNGMAERVIRSYDSARVTIAGQTRTLRPERALMVAHRLKDQLVTYSPKGPLFPDEMELTEHFDTLALPGLLPNREVKVGETWIVPPAVVQAICTLDALDAQVKQELTGELKALDGDTAILGIQGIVKGIQLGAPVSIHIAASTKLSFDVKHQRIIGVEWRQSDERAQGPASPNLAAEVAITVERSPIATPAELGDLALPAVPNGAPPASLTNLMQRDAKANYEFQHSREWHFVGDYNGQRILKLVTSRGDWIADATIMPWKGPKIADAAALQQLVAQSPGWQQEGDAQLDDAVKHPAGLTVFRVSAAGKMEGSAAFRSVYVLGNAAGQQILVTVIAPPSQVNNLAARDQTLIDGFELK